MSSRFLIVAPIAVIVTVALFFLMRDLIAASPDEPEIAERPNIDFTRKIKDPPEPDPTRLPPPDPKEPESQPQAIDPTDVPRPTKPTIIGKPVRPGGDNGHVVDINPVMDGGASPIIRPEPPYPGCGRGEGEVVLDYVVDPDGRIRDVTVVSATSSCFAQAAKRGTGRWQYRPQVVDGKPVRSGRMRVKLVFRPE